MRAKGNFSDLSWSDDLYFCTEVDVETEPGGLGYGPQNRSYPMFKDVAASVSDCPT